MKNWVNPTWKSTDLYASAASSNPNRYQKHYSAIWSHWPLLQRFETYDDETATCVRVESPFGDLIIYGTILTYAGDKGPEGSSGQCVLCRHRHKTHWTKHERRLNREFGRKRFGDHAYAREELVAELGAAFLCADLGITPEPREDHAAYLSHWLQVLREDKRAIFSAAAHAQRAVDYLYSLQVTQAQAA